MQAAPSPRENWIDFAKGIAIVLMVYGHASTGLLAAGLHVEGAAARFVEDALTAFRMPMFFFLAGLLVVPCLRKYGAGGFVRRRAEALLYPYVLWMLLQGFMQIAFAGVANRPAPPLETVFALWTPQYHFWFLYALFMLAVIAAGLGRVLGFAVLTAAGLALFFAPGALAVNPVLTYLPGTLVFFMAGAWAGPLAGRFARLAPMLLGPLLVLLAVALFLLRGQLADKFSAGSLVVGALAILVGCALSVCLARVRLLRGIAVLGAASLPIYLAHVIAAAGTRAVLLKGLGITSPALHLILGVAIGTLAPLALWMVAPRLRLGFLFALPRIRKTTVPAAQEPAR